ncbi:hypothetical protein [Pedobacter nanyangensis]|uniref:hypothetical protein n=1 Tax=Pedobacter nanyangensis TaxID=1562389 RepID=UPI000DE37A14|nr:hypothetical protein [Pedobacter nanyangensis]
MKTQQEQLGEFRESLKSHGERLSRLENIIPKYPKIRIPDYTSDLHAVRKSVDTFLQSNHQENMKEIMLQIRQLVAAMPEVVRVRHHHHFARLTKRVIIVFSILIVLLCLAIGLTYYFYRH